MPQVNTQNFFPASVLSVQNTQLQEALRRAGTGFDGARQEAIDEVGQDSWEKWREEARQIKVHTLEYLDYYLELLTDNVERAGGHVHFARDAAQANSIVAELATSRGVRVATKSKSMVSEELNLNEVLEQNGVDVYETDLGEYIIQLAGETPSHLVAPALHKTKEEVSQRLHEKLGVPLTDDIEAMARVARDVLRDKFFQADLGISGGQLPGRRNRHAGYHHQRRQRASLHLRAPHPHRHNRHGEGDTLLAGPGGVSAPAASLRYRTASDQLR